MMLFFRKKNYETLSDEELVVAYKKSDDKEPLGVLFKRYAPQILGVCIKYLESKEHAKDAVSEIFEKLLRDLKKHEITNFKPWLFTVARNYCLMELRTRKAMDVKENISLAHSDDFDDVQFNEEQLVLLEKHIRELDPDQRACIELFYLRELCYKEVCEITGFDMNKVKSYIQNGKRNLKIAMLRETVNVKSY